MTRQRPRFGYAPRRSFVHRLDPLTKLVVLVCIALLTVTLLSDVIAFVILLFVFVSYLGAGISLRLAFARLRSLIGLVLLIAFVQLLFTPYGALLFYLIPRLAPGFGPFLPVTLSGVFNALFLVLRLLNIVLASALFVFTTDPTLFVVALTRLHISYRYAFTLILALRLVPLFDEEMSHVRAAQSTRGISVDHGVLRGFFTRIRHTFLPMIFSALSRIDTLTLAMDGRGFGYARRRTYARRPHFAAKDWFITISSLLLTGFLLWHYLFIAPVPRLFG
jgi:energy-coupling factor transport system permease protein